MGLLLGVLTFAVYMVGSNRSFGYDAAATFANFIATPSLLDAFAFRSVIPTIPVTQVATNDHVLLSLASHVIFSLTGSRSEVVYRLLPGLAAGATVGLSTAVLTRRFGLIAGLCAATVVVEARERSGALITADFALEEGREVFAVPGEITSALSAGTNALLRLGATPLTRTDDVFELFGLERSAEGPKQAHPLLEHLPASVDELAGSTQLDAAQLASTLAELELAGLVFEGEGIFRRTAAG